MVVNFTIVPIGKESSLSTKVAEVLNIVSESGIDYKLHSMGTILEGDWDEIMRLIKKCHKKILKDSDRVLTTITIDDGKGRTGRIAGKVKSVEKKLGKKLKT
ncbi:cytosolic protein [Candidatus Scalindua japonica]|uniref:Cytosolic protein n=1 Tax=Candidatus Scalindua japonica TaxID=1284222 RepID=A0A286TWC7_9BACT|nr:MTH1187 family thiamine-binding protein [Candidatus Scalindua japonica]GAX60164.1 cytosolic protein [Candidatus Scalindua japonica]